MSIRYLTGPGTQCEKIAKITRNEKGRRTLNPLKIGQAKLNIW